MRSKDYVPLTPEGQNDVSIKAGEKKNQLRVRRIVESTDIDASPDFNAFLDSVTAAYKQVKVNK